MTVTESPDPAPLSDEAPPSVSVVGRSILWLLVSQVLTWAISVIVLILAPDRLGAANFGLLNFTIAFVGFFAFVGTLGTGQFITRSAARDPDLLGPYVVNGVVMKLVLSVLLSCLALGIGLALGYDAKTLVLIGIGLSGMTLTILNDVLLGGLVALNRVARTAMWWVVQTYLGAALAITVLFTTRSVLAFAATYAIALVIPVATNSVSVWHFVKGSLHIDPKLWVTLVKGGAPLLLLTGLILVYGTIDVPLLEWITDSVTVAHYTLAYRWVTIPVFIATAIVTASASSLSAMAVANPARFAALANRSLQLVLGISLPAAVGIYLIAYDLIDLLYSPEFYDSALIMRILAVHIPLAAVSTVLGAQLIASDRQGRYALVALIAALLNPPLTILCINLSVDWAHNGAIGAAVVTVATEVFMVYGAFRLRPRGVFDRETVFFGLRCLGACAGMAVVVSLLPDGELFVKVAIGLVVYVVAAVALRIITVDQIKAVPQNLWAARRYNPAMVATSSDAGDPADGR
jgi:O-antigen/teichoic acid export membrane protein